jgi:hypothetical protein
MIHPIKKIKAAFHRLVTALETLEHTHALNTVTVKANTIAVDALRTEQSELRERLDALVSNSHFIVRHKRAELTRAGHKAD